MLRQVQVLADNVALPNGYVYQTGDTVVLTREQFERIDPDLVTDSLESESESGSGSESEDVTYYVLDQGDVAILTTT